MALASAFSVALEQVVLTPVLKNPAISRKGAKTEQIYIDAKIAKSPISRKAKKNSTVLASDFSIPLEQVVHNPIGMISLQSRWDGMIINDMFIKN